MEQSQPFSYAHVALIQGDQGSGKSETGVARTIEHALRTIIALKGVKDGQVIKCVPLTREDKAVLESKGFAWSYDTIRAFLPNPTITSIRRLEQRFGQKFIIIPSIRIFANFHLHGVQYVFRTWSQIIEGLDQDIIKDGRLEVDETHNGANARESMGSLGRQLAKYNMSFRKRHLEVDFMIVNQRLGDWTIPLVVNEWISCVYDERRERVELKIRKKGESRARETWYDARIYRPYYDTDERFKLSSKDVNNAIAAAK